MTNTLKRGSGNCPSFLFQHICKYRQKQLLINKSPMQSCIISLTVVKNPMQCCNISLSADNDIFPFAALFLTAYNMLKTTATPAVGKDGGWF